MLVSVWGLLTAVVLAHMPVGQPSLRQASGLAARTALFGAPVMALLFLLFPRIGPLWGVPQDGISTTGLSNTMKMGSLSEVASDDSIAMRVRFEGEPPPPAERRGRDAAGPPVTPAMPRAGAPTLVGSRRLYASQECSTCGHTYRGNRPTRDRPMREVRPHRARRPQRRSRRPHSWTEGRGRVARGRMSTTAPTRTPDAPTEGRLGYHRGSARKHAPDGPPHHAAAEHRPHHRGRVGSGEHRPSSRHGYRRTKTVHGP